MASLPERRASFSSTPAPSRATLTARHNFPETIHTVPSPHKLRPSINRTDPLDWTLAITRNRDALKPIIAALCALAGMKSGTASAARNREPSPPSTLPRHVIAAILLVLRPAESAVRRLILIAASLRAFVIPDKRSSDPGSMPQAMSDFSALRRDAGGPDGVRTPAFALFDPLKSFDPDTIWNLDEANESGFRSGESSDPSTNWRILPDADESLSAASILRRLAAIARALNTLPYQARRLLRFNARRDAQLRKPFKGPIRLSPMRPGLPPGWRQRSIHEIDLILRECHGLAYDVMVQPDTT